MAVKNAGSIVWECDAVLCGKSLLSSLLNISKPFLDFMRWKAIKCGHILCEFEIVRFKKIYILMESQFMRSVCNNSNPKKILHEKIPLQICEVYRGASLA